MSNPLEMVKLKNGSEVPKSAVDVTMITLRSLMTDGIPTMLAVIDLAEHCRNGTVVSGRSLDILEGYGLIEHGRVHDITKDVVISASEGEGLEFALVSPYESEE